MISDFSYRLVVATSLVGLLILFSSIDNGICTTTAAISVGKDEAYSCFEYWTNRYQSLIGAIATLVAAYFAYRAVRRQIDQNERHAHDRVVRDADAAKAVLPLSLTAVCDYAVECMQQLAAAATPADAQMPWPPHELPTFPSAVISPLEAGVRHADRVQAKMISDLILTAQIQSSRLKKLSMIMNATYGASYRNYNIENGIYDAAALYARAAALFDFARDGYMRLDTTAVELKSGLMNASIQVENFPHLEWRLKRLEEEQAQGFKN